MSHKPGTKLNGVHTLEDLRQRCFINEETDCWHLRAAVNHGSTRIWAFDPERGKSCAMTGPRAAWVLSGGCPIRGKTVYHARCTHFDCVNPGHLAAGTKAEHGAALKRLGHLRGDPARAIVNKRNGRARSKFTPELRQVILDSDEPAVHLALKLGIGNSTISYIRQGKRWRDGLIGSSVFTQKVLA